MAAAGSSGGSAAASGAAAAVKPVLDLQWVEARTKKATLKMEKLDTDLKNSKVCLNFINYCYFLEINMFPFYLTFEKYF